MSDRKYLASCDDGHDYFSFEFYSCHRANSKANKEDAKTEYRRMHGRRNYKILQTTLEN